MEAVGIVKPAVPVPAPAPAPAVPKAAPAWDVEITEEDLAAAEQLLQLSVSGGESGRVVGATCSATSLSPRSVTNNAEVAVAGPEEEDDDAGLDQRAKKKYRLVSELYAVTKPVKAAGAAASTSGKRNVKGKMEN